MPKLYQKFYDISRFVLWADSPAEDGKRARFVLSMRDGNPRFNVYTGGTGANTSINFPMSIPDLTALMVKLKEIAVGENGQSVSVDSLGSEYANDKPTGNKKVISSLHMGKSKDGIVYVSITAEGRPRIVFPIKSSPFMVYRNSAKEQLAESEVSRVMALGFAGVVLDAISQLMINYTNEEYDSGARTATPIKGRDGEGRPTSGGAKAASQPQFQDLDDLML